MNIEVNYLCYTCVNNRIYMKVYFLDILALSLSMKIFTDHPGVDSV